MQLLTAPGGDARGHAAADSAELFPLIAWSSAGAGRDRTRRGAAAAAGRTLFQQEQPSGHSEQPPGGARWAAAVRVTAAEILLLLTPGDSNSLEL